jgi:hypothetical protein
MALQLGKEKVQEMEVWSVQQTEHLKLLVCL